MSLRGAKRLRGEAEANSCIITRLFHFVRNDTLCQIATLPTVARNDKRGLRHSLYCSAITATALVEERFDFSDHLWYI